MSTDTNPTSSEPLHHIKRFQRLTQRKLPAEQSSAAVEGWLGLTQSDIDTVRAELRRRPAARMLPALAWILGGLVVAISVAGGTWGYLSGEVIVPHAILLAGITAVFSSLAAAGVHAIIREIFGGPLVLDELLRPTSETPYLCYSALAVVNQHQELRAFRDAVVAAGRGLTGLDIHYIHVRQSGIQWEAYEAEQRKVCRQLHGLEPADTPELPQ